ncbi:MAG TPA: Smr/MutS family protein, partial [Nannocystaceae bacterium]|nr:Smr/MutS family protein [Nannocystaceae bacterium]
RVTQIELRNPERVPPGLALGEAGLLPYAPWSGTLAQPDLAAPAELPIDGELDLHNFAPKEVDPLVRAYIDECLARGILHLRIVHGKGIGALRRTVQAILSRHPAVESQRLGGHGEGSWGATIVTLRSPVK